MAKKSKKSKKKGIGRLIALTLVSILLFTVGGGMLYINGMLNQLNRDPITGNASMTEEEIYKDESRFDVSDSVEDLDETKKDHEQVQKVEVLDEAGIENILLIGSDRRSASENGRSDSMILVSINHNTGKIHMVSLMRAMYVHIPKSGGGVWGMLNAAYSWGGPQLLMDTIESNFRVKIHHYAIIDFSSFTSVVDAVGGVDIKLSAQEAAYMSSYAGGSFSAGTYTLNGAQALVYSRMRFIDNDFVRTSRQRNVVNAVLNKAKTIGVPQLLSLANTLLPLISTDMNNGEVLGYVTNAPKMLSYAMSQRMLPVENENGGTYVGIMYVNGMEVYKVDFANNIKELHAFLMS